MNNRNIPFVLLLNKKDKDDFLSTTVIDEALQETLKGFSHCYPIVGSAVSGLGLIDALSWIENEIKKANSR